jgi:hypothetical protein
MSVLAQAVWAIPHIRHAIVRAAVDGERGAGMRLLVVDQATFKDTADVMLGGTQVDE